MSQRPFLDAWRLFQTTGQDLYGSTGLSPEELQKAIDAGLVTPRTWNYSNESGSGTATQYDVDWSKMPAIGPPGVGNKYGNWMPTWDGRMIDPKLTYNDPNYGLLTPSFNDKANKKDAYDLLGPAFAALLTMGVGAPWYLGAGLNAVKGIGSGVFSHWTDVFNGKGDAAATNSQPKSTSTPPPGGLPSDYTPNLYGNMGSLAAPPDGSQPVMSSLVPNAYDNSSPNTVVS